MRDQAVAKHIAERLTLLAESRGLSQRALARKSGLPPEVVSRAVRGQHTPSIATLEKLCGGLEISLSAFFSEPFPVASEPAPVALPSSAKQLARLMEGLPPRSQALVLKGMESIIRGLQANTRSRPGR